MQYTGPPPLGNSTGALYGCLSLLVDLLRDERPGSFSKNVLFHPLAIGLVTTDLDAGWEVVDGIP